jgi:hypothetical protein
VVSNVDTLEKGIVYMTNKSSSPLRKIPRQYRNTLWTAVKVRMDMVITEEIDHFTNCMALHFGLSRNQVVSHAISLLWAEVVETIGAERLQQYEEKLEAVRLHRLKQQEEGSDKKRRRMQHHAQNKEKPIRFLRTLGTVWVYDPPKRLVDMEAIGAPDDD